MKRSQSADDQPLFARSRPRGDVLFEARFRRDVLDAGIGRPAHSELKLDSFTLGIATIEAAKNHHGLEPGDGRGVELVLWADDTAGTPVSRAAGRP